MSLKKLQEIGFAKSTTFGVKGILLPLEPQLLYLHVCSIVFIAFFLRKYCYRTSISYSFSIHVLLHTYILVAPTTWKLLFTASMDVEGLSTVGLVPKKKKLSFCRLEICFLHYSLINFIVCVLDACLHWLITLLCRFFIKQVVP